MSFFFLPNCVAPTGGDKQPSAASAQQERRDREPAHSAAGQTLFIARELRER